MGTAKLYFECENCGQPFDIEIDSGHFEYTETGEKGGRETERDCAYEFKSESHCCGKNIEIKIFVRQYRTGTDNRYDIYHRGLRNLRTGDNFNNIINEVFKKITGNMILLEAVQGFPQKGFLQGSL